MRILTSSQASGGNGIGGVNPDAAGLYSQRSSYDAQAPGFVFLATDTEALYVRLSAGGWSGAISVRGPAGPEGPQGAAGPTGATGGPGASGNGILSGTGSPAAGLGVNGDWYIDTGADAIYGPKTAGAWGSPTSLVGPAGAAGATGSQGPAATIAVGTVTTGAAGSSASIVNSGTTGAAVFDFTIPRGEVGNTGPTGATGSTGPQGQAATISVGSVTTGAAGGSASVTNTGTSSAAVLAFTIPRGDTGSAGAAGETGPQGLQGPQGLAGTITVGTVTTGSPGTSATVTNTGTSSAAVFDFTIPRGADGGVWTTIEKTADQTRTATVTLAADSALAFSMAANARYLIRLEVWFDTTSAADFKFRHVGPASPTLVRLQRQTIIAGGSAFTNVGVDTAFSAADVTVNSINSGGGYVSINGIVHNGATAGTFSFQWAQNSSDAGNTIVRAGSYLEYSVV